MTETKPKRKKRIDFARFFRVFGTWSLAIIGSLGVTLLLLVLAGVFHEKVPTAEPDTVRRVPVDAVVGEVRLIRQPRYESAVGAIEPIHEAAVAAKILAKVTDVTVTAGQKVEIGEVLVQLADDDLQSRLKQAEADHTAAVAHASQAKADFDRAQRLVQNNAMSRAEFEAAATRVQTTTAGVERSSRAIDEAKVFVGYATIVAPLSGIVVDKQVQAGETVTPGQTLLTLYDPDQMQLVANVRESLAMQLKIGQPVQAELVSMEHQCEAIVREVVPQADAGSRSFQVKVSGPCPPGIYSGMFGRILLPLADEELVVVAASAVRRVGQLTLVDVVEGDRLARRNLQLGRRVGDAMEVLSGLLPGEQVLLPSHGEGAGQ